MKKKILAIILSIATVLAVVCVPKVNNTKLNNVGAITGTYTLNPTEFHIANYYSYRLNKALTKTPDSFEAWIYVAANSTGGVLLSNHISDDRNYTNKFVEYSIDAVGRVNVNWGGTTKIAFRNGFVADGNWHHIAVVRNKVNSTFTLYLDGEENTVASAYNTCNPISDRPLSIGVDLPSDVNTDKKPLQKGKIKQITIYNGTITQARVKQDMNNTAINTDDTSATLLTNVYLGDPWTKRIVEDSSKNDIDAYLSSYDKLVRLVEPDAYDYSLLVIPDIQTTVNYKSKLRPTASSLGKSHPFEGVNPPATYDTSDNTEMAQWIKWLKTTPTKYKTKFAMQVGDLSDWGQHETFYKWGAYYMNQLNGVLPWSFVQGNHDYDGNCDSNDSRKSTYFNTHFPYSVHSTLPGFGGTMEGTSMSNTYYRYEVGDVKYLVINLEFGPRMSVLRWAGRLCEQFYDHRVILNTHGYMESDASLLDTGDHYSAETYAWNSATEANSATVMFNELVSQYANIFMVVCGHITAEDIIMRQDVGVHGNKITSLLIDFQTAEHRGSGTGTEATCLMFFNEAEKTINFAYYSAVFDAVYNVHNQFRISFADALNPTIGA